MWRFYTAIKKKKKCEKKNKKISSPGGLEPPTFRLTAERANRLRHGDHLKNRGEILNFKSNDLFHYVIVPISFPDALLFTFSSFSIFFLFFRVLSFIAELHKYGIFPYRIRENAKSVDGNFNRIWLLLVLAGKRDSPKFGHGMQDFFFPVCWEIETAQMYVVPSKANNIVSWLTFLEIKWREFIRYF